MGQHKLRENQINKLALRNLLLHVITLITLVLAKKVSSSNVFLITRNQLILIHKKYFT